MRQPRDDPVAVLHAGGMERQHKSATIRVDPHVPRAALDLPARVVASRTARLGRLHALAVDYRRTRACLPSAALTVPHHRVVVDLLPDPCITPSGKPAVDGLPGWKAKLQHPPGDAPRQYVEDGVDYLPPWPSRGSAREASGRWWGRDDGPLGVGQVTGKA